MSGFQETSVVDPDPYVFEPPGYVTVILCMDPDLDPDIYFYSFVTFYNFFSREDRCKCTFKMVFKDRTSHKEVTKLKGVGVEIKSLKNFFAC